MLFRVVAAAITCIPSIACSQLLPITLYDGSDPRPPEAQSWLWFEDNPVGSAARSTSGGRTRLSTLAAGNSLALYGTRSFSSGPTGGAPHPLVLSRATGFSFSLDMNIISETHQSLVRGGFFQQIRTSSVEHGIMLFGWEDRLFSWTPEDAIGESATVDLRADRTVTTTVLGDGYSVLVDGQLVLSGPLRNYVSFDIVPFRANSIAFGDFNISSAVDMEFTRAVIRPIPEPAAAIVFLVGLCMSRRQRSISTGR